MTSAREASARRDYPALRRRDPGRGRTRSPPPMRRRRGLPLVVVGPGREPRARARARARAERTCAATSTKDELAELYRGGGSLLIPTRTRASGCPCSRRWRRDAGRRRPGSGGARGRGRRGGLRGAGRLRPPRPRVLADPERVVAAGLERARAFSWGETARATAAVYREVSAVKVSPSSSPMASGTSWRVAARARASGRRGARDRESARARPARRASS